MRDGSRLELVRKDQRYSDQYRQQLLAETRSKHAAQLERDARDAWKNAQQHIASVTTDISKTVSPSRPAPTGRGSITWYRNTAPSWPPRQTPSSAAVASSTGCVTCTSALPHRAMHCVCGRYGRLPARSSSACASRRRPRRMRPCRRVDSTSQVMHDPLEETLAQLKQERRVLVNQDLPALRAAILGAEQQATGFNHNSPFAGLSPWMADVLGEDHASTGMVVFKSHEGAPVLGDQAADEHPGVTEGLRVLTPKPTPLRRRKPGDIRQLRAVLWGSLIELETIILGSDDPLLTIRASHALGTLAGSYVKCIEVADVTARLDAIEAELATVKGMHVVRRAS